ncbi:hypothetical protein ACFE04_004289 [Oxalis oulophora]
MDLQMVVKGLDSSRKRKKWLILMAGLGFSAYGVYKVYNLPSVVKRRESLRKLVGAMISMAELVSDSAEMMSNVSKDWNQFIQSDSDEIPNSLKQVMKIARSDEFAQSLISVSQGMTIGILRGYKVENMNVLKRYANRVMDTIFSEPGTGFVSVVVGTFARNLVLGLYSRADFDHDSAQWLNVVCNKKSKELIADCVQKFVSTAIAVYLDKTNGINSYDDFFSGLTNPKHQDNVRDILVTVCNSAVETMVKTSHQVLTDPNESKNVSSDNIFEREVSSKESSYVRNVSSAWVVPRNQKFVRDVTGRVTYETIQSLVEFLVRKLSDTMKNSFHTVHDEVLDRGQQVVRYIGAKSSIIFTVCLALYLHAFGGSKILMTA